MRRIARFMKVSREQFTADFKDAFPGMRAGTDCTDL